MSRITACILALLLAAPVYAQETGSCERAEAEAYLDVNNVRARILNNGGLFWRGDPAVYAVPKGGGVGAIFAARIWIGGMRENVLHMAGSTYGPYEFWPGPLTGDGTFPDPTDCSSYDRIYSLGVRDLLVYEATGIATDDLREWPAELGAPVVDGNGDPTDYSLAEGDRPDPIGHQTHWWIMNDLGNQHERTKGLPLGVEIRAEAFAYSSRVTSIDNATFYRYTIRNPQSTSLDMVSNENRRLRAVPIDVVGSMIVRKVPYLATNRSSASKLSNPDEQSNLETTLKPRADHVYSRILE